MQVASNLPFTVNNPELPSIPITFLARQVYTPTSNDCAFTIESELLTTVPLNGSDETLYLLISDTFILTPLKYQLIFGIGSPVA